jgi:biotin carboxylase
MMSDKKKLLILGGSANQLRLVEAAKKAGIYTVVCNWSEDCAAREACDKFYTQNYLDKEQVLAIAKDEKVDGVISNSEAAMLIVAYVAEKLGLPGNSVRGIEQLVSKTEFRQLQRNAGVYAPRNFECGTWEEFEKQVNGLTFPIIIKPCESSGTRGTTRVDSKEDKESQKKAFEECQHFSVNDRVSVEEFVEMTLLTVIDGDVFVCNGEYLWNGFFSCYRSCHATMLPMMESFPIVISDKDFDVVKDHIKRIFEQAGIVHGQYNAEMYFTKTGELFVIEINARQGGVNIPHLIELHSGIDFDKLLVTTAVGDNSEFEEALNAKHEIRYITQFLVFSRSNGVLNRVEIHQELMPYLIERTDLKKPGDEVVVGMNAGDSIARLVFDFKDFETQQHYVNDIENYVSAIVD